MQREFLSEITVEVLVRSLP